MASRKHCVAEPDQSPPPVQETPTNDQAAELDYDFVEQTDQDYFCPVSLELLIEPHQTSCCGHHISQQAANRLARELKPCPMCKDEEFNTQPDKYFKRKVRQLKVHCPHKKSWCEWTGELGDLNHHTTACPKRPWKCQYCDFESIYEIGPNDHTPNCANYPMTCPNQCEIGTVPRRDADSHLLECPLQLVECEFAGNGCAVKVPRRELVSHMTDNAQHHLMTATLLNLRLTRELHQKMEEKDQQITELKQITKKDLDKLQQQTKDLDTKLQLQLDTSIKLLTFTCHTHTLTGFSQCQAKGSNGSWYSEPFYNCHGGYNFKLNIDTNGYKEARGTHLTAYLYLYSGNSDKRLRWPLKLTVILDMLNQEEDHGEHSVTKVTEFNTATPPSATQCKLIGITPKFYPIADLNEKNYLRNNEIKFRLWLKAN